MNPHLPGHDLIRNLFGIDEGLEQFDRRDGDDGADQFEFEVREADLAHPTGAVFVFAEGDLGDEIFVTAEDNNKEEGGDQGGVNQGEDGDDGLVARQAEDIPCQTDQFLGELYEQGKDGEDEAGIEGCQEPPASEDGRFKVIFQFVHCLHQVKLW